jgi:anti-sigma regulatory factor (Ser/Thr protein kinase)
MRRIAARADNSAHARRIVASVLGRVSPEVLEIAQLLVSELTSNAIIHGSGDAALVVQADNHSLHVEVLDSESTTNFAPLHLAKSSPHGRGLALVEALASSWGVEPRLIGKAVWFDLDF